MSEKLGGSQKLVEKWEAALDGINDSYTRRVTAQLLENQAATILAERQKLEEEALTPGSTTVGQLGTFQKFAFPLVRRVYPELIANRIVGVQPMNGPVSQIFYIGHTRAGSIMGTYGQQQVYGKYKLTYRGMTTSAIGSVSGIGGTWHSAGGGGGFGATGHPLDGHQATGVGFDVSNLINVSGNEGHGGASATFGGQIASWPDPRTTLGWTVSAGEQLRTSGIPELTFHIEQQPVVARTRKMRALWTIEASQDLKAYHDLDLERELTDLLSKELALEIDRELVEDIRMVAYGFDGSVALGAMAGGWVPGTLDNANSNAFGAIGGGSPNNTAGFAPSAFLYDFVANGGQAQANTPESNVWVVDLTNDSGQFTGTTFAPQHVGHKYSNLLAAINFASQDIYRTTFRGPGTFLVTSPIVGSMLESAAKLEGGLAEKDKPTNMGTSI
jgi:hypothetical protein